MVRASLCAIHRNNLCNEKGLIATWDLQLFPKPSKASASGRWARVARRHRPSKAAEIFGSLAFNDKAQQERLPKPVYRALRATITRGEPLDLVDRGRGGDGAEGLGGGARRHALHALVPADDRHHRGEARFVSVADGRWQRDRGVPRQGADQGRARCLELPVGRHAIHLRGARLHRVGSDESALAALQRRQQRDAGDSDRVRELDGRGTRQEDAAAALDGSGLEAGRARAEAVRLDGRARLRDVRSGAGILPDRPQLLFRAPRSDQRGPHALRRQAAEGPGDGGPVLRRHPGARAGVHGRNRARAVQGRRAGQDAAQRGRAEPVPKSPRCSRTPTSPSTIR